MNKRENCGYYDYSVYEFWPDCHRDKCLGYAYTIYKKDTDKIVRESEEWFDSEAQAGFAAIGHISLLENGEG